MDMSDTLELFGGYTMTADQARAAIRAYAHTGVIREWCTVPSASNPQATTCYAGIRSEPAGPSLTRSQPRPHLLVGHGASPTAALEDLLWRVVGPHLLKTQP